MANIQTNDAAGGAGSLVQGLLGIAINGLSRAVDGKLSQKYPLTSFNENVTVNAEGEVKPRSAPAANVKATSVAAGILSNPVVMSVAAVVGLGIVAFIVYKAVK